MPEVDNQRHNQTESGHSPGDDTGPSFTEFRNTFREAFLHLYTPEFKPSSLLCAVIGCDGAVAPGLLQSRIIASIGYLVPDSTVPTSSRAQRAFLSLHERFVIGLTQEETAELLCVSVRHVQRIQRDAMYSLAGHLWQRWLARQGKAGDLQAHNEDLGEDPDPRTQGADWRSQTKVELASLQASGSEAVADVIQTIRGVILLKDAATAHRGSQLAIKFVQPGLTAAVHPAALRQMLITAIGRLARYASPGPLAIFASLEDGQVKITLTAQASLERGFAADEILRDILVPDGASVELHRGRSRIFLALKLRALDERTDTVFVVEDNPDMILFYRHCTAGTPYRIVHIKPDQDIIRTIDNARPDVVLLDVMMPDVDGWQILIHLHERPSTRDIPVIVCSVVKEDELARALGAVCFLSKPVEPRRLVEALDRARHRVST